MEIIISKNDQELSQKAAAYTAQLLNETIQSKGEARLLLSTGNSQLNVINELLKQVIDWKKVEMFHLDEYIGISMMHKASFRKYLKEKFVDKVNLKAFHFVSGEGDVNENIQKLTEEVKKAPINVALIGIGENAHIAFNDPPADFNTTEAYIRVKLDTACKNQQVGEGWFPDIGAVPEEAITMTVHQIMKSENIISCVPYKVKAEAIKKTLNEEVNNLTPSTKLKEHKNIKLFLDEESASLLNDKDFH